MNRIRLYLREAYSELLYKVTWPTWPELQATAVVVLVAMVIISLVVLAMDQTASFALDSFYHMFD
jgi:preprotein translocase subunit SecE